MQTDSETRSPPSTGNNFLLVRFVNFFRAKWIKYSIQDAVATFELQKVLQKKLEKVEWGGSGSNMWNFYEQYWRPFGVLLTDMERKGILVDTDYLKQIQLKAEADRVCIISRCGALSFGLVFY